MTSCFLQVAAQFFESSIFFFTDPFKIGTDVALTEPLFLFGGAFIIWSISDKWKFALDSLERNLKSKQ